MAPCRVIFMGTPAFAVPCLAALCEQPQRYHVVAVVTQPDRLAGRGRRLRPSEVKRAAESYGIPVLEPTRLKSPETLELLKSYRPDVMVVAAYGRILPPSVLDVPSLGCINVHASLLPRHRGASPVAHAILAADATCGVSLMQMDAGMDTGPVYRQQAIPLDPSLTCGALTEVLAQRGAAVLRETLPLIVEGRCQAQPQPQEGVTHAPPLTKDMGWLNWSDPAPLLERQIRAFTPWPGALAQCDGKLFTVLSAHVAPEDAPEGTPKDTSEDAPGARPGQVLEASCRGVLVACGEGALWIDTLKPAGRHAMSAAAWVAGRGMKAGAYVQSPRACENA